MKGTLADMLLGQVVRGAREIAPPQLEPAPAVRPKQWRAVAISWPSSSSRLSTSKIVRVAPRNFERRA